MFARVDRGTGLLAPAGDDSAIFMPFREGSAPTEVSPTNDGSRRPPGPCASTERALGREPDDQSPAKQIPREAPGVPRAEAG